jgi:hypothetical protein
MAMRDIAAAGGAPNDDHDPRTSDRRLNRGSHPLAGDGATATGTDPRGGGEARPGPDRAPYRHHRDVAGRFAIRSRRRTGPRGPRSAVVVHPARTRRQHRVRRGVHGRRLGRRRPRRRPGTTRAQRRHVDPAVLASPAPVLRPETAGRRRQQPARRAPQHRASLRPVERTLRGIPRRDDDVLVRTVRRRLRRTAAGRAATQDRPSPRPHRRRRRHPPARDRHRMG